MGLLNFIEHPVNGLLGLFGQGDQSQYIPPGNPVAPASYGGLTPSQTLVDQIAQTPPPQRQPGFLGGLARLPGAYVNDLLTEMQAGPDAAREASQLRQQIAALPMDPREKAVAMANPVAWSKENATRYAYHGINGGDTGVYGDPRAGGYSITAPKYGENDGRGYSVGPNGLTDLGELAPSFGQRTSQQNADTKAAELNQGRVVGPGGHLVGPDGRPLYDAPFAPRLQAVDPAKDLYQTGGPSSEGPSSASQMLAILPRGSRVTSTSRSPDHNANVGGVPNSHHLDGSAIDFIPPPGVTIAQVKQQYAAAGHPLVEAMDEGDHFHIAWTPSAASPVPRLIKKGVAPVGGGGLDPQAVENLAQQYAAGDKSVISSLGRNAAGQADRTRVLNRSVEIMAGQGQSGGDAVGNRSALAANQSALKKITTTRDQIKASEDTVAANMGIVLDLAPKGGGPTPSPLLNTPIQYWRKQVAGSADVSAFDNAIGTVADEYAKVMTTTSGAGGGVSSDNARKEAYSRLNKSANFAMLQSNMATMQKEMDNRVAAFNKQEDAILQRIKGQGGPPQPAAPPQKRYSPEEAAKLPKGTQFMTTDGRVLVRH